ncbi:MAG: glycosyltransferase family 2 protein [Desulfobacterales bacterium]|nr:glycosyltransferase family 2 protein [Desulfobacterales bacterium]
MRHSTLSVVVPNYNHGKHIARAIDSVVSQSRPPDEYIILDDASDDDSVEIIESYARRYPYIRFVRNDRNTGAMAAFERVYSMATGDYVYGGAADDYVLPGFFEKAMEMAEHYPHAGIICGDVVGVDLDGREIFFVNVPRWTQPLFAPPDIYLRDFINLESATSESLSSAVIYKRSALEEVGGIRQELISISDFFAIRSIALKYGACYIPERFAVLTHNPDGLYQSSRSDPKLMLSLIARAAWLMRSFEFKDRFPEEHVKQMEQRYRKAVITDYVRKTDSLFNRIKETYYYGFSLGNRNKMIIFVLTKCLGLIRRIFSTYLKYVLNNYPGDVSCYRSPDK